MSDHFLFLHVPRTGGTWVATVLLKHAPQEWGVRMGPYHAERAALPSLPAFAFVRNPWDWYVSLVAFWSGHYLARTGWSDAAGHAERGFGGPENSWSQAARWWAARFRSCGVRFEPVLRSLAHEPGLSLAAYQQRLGDAWVGRYEQLGADLCSALARIGLETSSVERGALTVERAQAAHRSPYQDYYTASLRDLVAKAEAPIIERFGYEF